MTAERVVRTEGLTASGRTGPDPESRPYSGFRSSFSKS
jgi:hypothetical protein